MTMTPNPIPQSLEELLGHAQNYAEFTLRYSGTLPGTLFLLGPKGPAAYVPASLQTEAAKDAFAANARLLSVAQGATAAVMALEAWTKLAEPGVPLDLHQRPSEAPDRQEMVSLLGEAAGVYQVQFLPILRDRAGLFTGFGTALRPACDQIGGRFAQILPLHTPTAQEQARAQAQLRANGIIIAAPSTQPPRPRPSQRYRFDC